MDGEWIADRIYDRCAYLNCYNGRYSTGHKLFRFPSYKDPRHHLWIRYTGNYRLRGWASATIRRAGLCEDHFPPDSFTDITRQTLRREAVPKPYSATDCEAQASPTLLAQIKSLPNCRTMGKKYLEQQKKLKEAALNSQQSSDAPSDDPSDKSLKNEPIQTNVIASVKDLPKVTVQKIQEELKSKLNGNYQTVVLEKCKNLETCPASRHATQIGGKARPHYHKIYASNSQGAKNKRKTVSTVNRDKVDVSQNDDKSVDATELRVNTPQNSRLSESITNTESEDASKSVDKTMYLINGTESLSKNIKSNGSSESQDDEHSESTQAPKDTTPDHIRRQIVANEIKADYYKTKDERVFDRCVYLNCNNGKFTTGSRLFRFPLHTDPRLTTWIKNTGNPKILYWSWATIRRAGLCGDHFTDESFCNETRQRLLRSAVPKPYDHEKNECVLEVNDSDFTQNDITDMFGTDDDDKDEEDETEIIGDSDALKNRPFQFANTSEVTKASFSAVEKTEPQKNSSVFLKTDSIDLSNDKEATDLCPATSEIDVDDPTDERIINGSELMNTEDANASISNAANKDDMESACDIKELRALREQKALLRKTIKQFSVKLKNAKIRKNKLQSQLLAYSDINTH